MAATPSKQFDLVVFGATGDAGRAIALYLAKHAPSSCRWAIAGRNANKLHRVMKSLGESPRCKMLLASCDDMNSMTAMARDTRLVLSAAGPYTTLGEPVILACLAGEAHYVDITGELDWVAAMKAKYDTQARSKGLCICSFCGYDCEPSHASWEAAILSLHPTPRAQAFPRSSLCSTRRISSPSRTRCVRQSASSLSPTVERREAPSSRS